MMLELKMKKIKFSYNNNQKIRFEDKVYLKEYAKFAIYKDYQRI